MGYRLGVDVGGTFTDILMFEEKGGRSFRSKLPSTPSDPSKAVVSGVKALCDKVGVKPAEITQFLHGTTVTTNAVLEGTGARVGLVVTEGYRQILQIARSLVPGGLAAWIIWPKPQPMARLEDTVEVSGRIDGKGAVVRDIDMVQARRALEALKASGVEAVTVCLMNSYLNPEQERRIGALAAEIFQGVPVSLSCDILPEMYEYERALTTVANSAVRPIIGKYVRNLERDLREIGVAAPINLLRSDGGLMSAAKAQDAPVNLLMSGPAGGVAGALWVARQAGVANVLTLDVGGTSTDVALVENGEPRLVRETEVGHLSVRAPSLDVKTVGAGGGSIAHVPELTKALRVGPASAGADPGPACYGKGGDKATVTDAHVVLGNLPTALLGGSFELDRAASERVVRAVADGLGVPLLEAAQGVIDIANENMFGALRMISVQQGYDPRDFSLMPFGGAGALHACAVAKLLHAWPVIVPRAPGVLCALGDATTRSRAEFSRSFNTRAADTTEDDLVAAFAEMKERVANSLAAEGVATKDAEFRYQIDLRYYGQGFELPIARKSADRKALDLKTICGDFDAEHRRMFMFNMETAHEIVNLRVVGLGPAPELPHEKIERGDGDPKRALRRPHTIYFGGDWRKGGLYDRALLRAGDVIDGPAIITEMDSTTLLHPDCVATVDAFGNLMIKPGRA